MNSFDARDIRVLLFDVFGTVVDWRGSIVREGEALAAHKRLKVDWPAFADAWRAGYRPAMQRVMQNRAAAGDTAWANIDTLHREILDGLLTRFGLDGLSEPERAHLNRVWHRLDPWPDAVDGLTQLKSRHTVATLSNGNIALLVAMAKRAALPWDCVLSAEVFRRYKPDLEVYRSAAQLLGADPAQTLMVAAHPSDLRAARTAGLRTAYVKRPFENGPNPEHAPPPDALPDDRFDLVADDFVDLARRLHAAGDRPG